MRVFAIIGALIMSAFTIHSVQAAQKRLPAKPVTPAKAPSPSWEMGNEIDSMTDVASFSASRRGDAGLISIDCKRGDKNSGTVLVGSDKFLGSNRVGPRDLTYRLDASPAVEGRWVYSGQAAMLTNTDQAAVLLIPMMKASKLLVRMYAYDGTSVDVTFDVTGSAIAIKQLMGSCQIG